MTRLNILVSAHEFSPEQGSECSEGWNLATRLARFHNVTVLYASGSQFQHYIYLDAINRYILDYGPISGLILINIDQPKRTKFLALLNSFFLKNGSIGLPILYFTAYKYWQKAAYRKAKKLVNEKEFHIVHQLTQITFREPGYLWKLGIPFFWGPTGGATTIPNGFFIFLSWKSKLFETIRSFSNFYQFRFVHRIIQANKRAHLIYLFTKEDSFIFKKRAKGKIKLMLDAGTTFTKLGNVVLNEVKRSVTTAIWCGQLIERKAPSILIQAIGAGCFQANKIKFLIIGDGPLRNSLIQLADELNISNIEWIKNVSHDRVFEIMGSGDFFIHTSYREATSNVIPEALSMGLPVICHNVNGMSLAINESCGIKVPLISFDESVIGFQNAIDKLITDPIYLEQLKYGALARAEEISWDKMAADIANDYLKVYN